MIEIMRLGDDSILLLVHTWLCGTGGFQLRGCGCGLDIWNS